jgi:hypothetical protein
MSSIFSQHGICFHAKEASALGSNRGCWERVDLAWEMLLSSTNTMALGKLLTLDKRIIGSMKIRTPSNWRSLGRYRIMGSIPLHKVLLITPSIPYRISASDLVQ